MQGFIVCFSTEMFGDQPVNWDRLVIDHCARLNLSLPLTPGTLKRRRAQQHAREARDAQVHQSQSHHGDVSHGQHRPVSGGQRQQPSRQPQPQRHHRSQGQPRENYQMGQMRR